MCRILCMRQELLMDPNKEKILTICARSKSAARRSAAADPFDEVQAVPAACYCAICPLQCGPHYRYPPPQHHHQLQQHQHQHQQHQQTVWPCCALMAPVCPHCGPVCPAHLPSLPVASADDCQICRQQRLQTPSRPDVESSVGELANEAGPPRSHRQPQVWSQTSTPRRPVCCRPAPVCRQGDRPGSPFASSLSQTTSSPDRLHRRSEESAVAAKAGTSAAVGRYHKRGDCVLTNE
ncbi:unnamed protein product [Protopolystoma xenopodis]|uniref:Uncharacterized protein n=1 Tax=Protopolystoma xenopodis TaxID=117903 RepID=A0A448WR71_9PLAT|nr:unnamed protein product [Protopolystoma xenopodis]